MFRVKKSVTPAEHKHSLGGFEHDTPYFMQHQIVCVVNPLVDGDRTAGGQQRGWRQRRSTTRHSQGKHTHDKVLDL